MSRLSPSQKQSLRQNGYLLIENAVSEHLVNRALHTIYHRLGQGVPKEEIATWQSQSFFPELKTAPPILDLVNESGVLATLQELIGEENVVPFRSAQLALRFPREYGTEPRVPSPHIDGVHSPLNGVPQGELHSFTALVGVFLTDVKTDFAGNLSVWPGSHTAMESYFQEHGIEGLLKEGVTPAINLKPPVQIKAKAGDCIIAHYQLLHGVTMNIAPNPRFAIFFRVKHPLHEDHKLQCLTHLWKEWPGIA
jgi:hypothetical protein